MKGTTTLMRDRKWLTTTDWDLFFSIVFRGSGQIVQVSSNMSIASEVCEPSRRRWKNNMMSWVLRGNECSKLGWRMTPLEAIVHTIVAVQGGMTGAKADLANNSTRIRRRRRENRAILKGRWATSSVLRRKGTTTLTTDRPRPWERPWKKLVEGWPREEP